MLKKGVFQKPNNALEAQESELGAVLHPSIPDALYIKCAGCRKMLLSRELDEQGAVCGKCGYHFRMSGRRRIEFLCDPGSFTERDEQLCAGNPIDFPGYAEKLSVAREVSGEREAVITGVCRIGGHACALLVMESGFMMGSMGTAVGEKVARLFEFATAKSLPVIGCTCSGGARMQEGILSLMQMAKTSGAALRHSDAGGLYVALLTDPTTGGVTASFAMQADIILAEPGALIAFAGPKVIEQTTRQKLPQGFQRAEFLLRHGFVDDVVPRKAQRETLAAILALHAGKEAGT